MDGYLKLLLLEAEDAAVHTGSMLPRCLSINTAFRLPFLHLRSSFFIIYLSLTISHLPLPLVTMYSIDIP